MWTGRPSAVVLGISSTSRTTGEQAERGPPRRGPRRGRRRYLDPGPLRRPPPGERGAGAAAARDAADKSAKDDRDPSASAGPLSGGAGVGPVTLPLPLPPKRTRGPGQGRRGPSGPLLAGGPGVGVEVEGRPLPRAGGPRVPNFLVPLWTKYLRHHVTESLWLDDRLKDRDPAMARRGPARLQWLVDRRDHARET